MDTVDTLKNLEISESQIDVFEWAIVAQLADSIGIPLTSLEHLPLVIVRVQRWSCSDEHSSVVV